MQNAILKFQDYQGKFLISDISQGQKVGSHINRNGANDFNGRGPSDRVDLLAPYDCKVVAIARGDNTVLFESLDEVNTPSGTYPHCWFMCTHMLDSDYNLLGIAVGKIFRQGQPCYTEGNKGLGDGGYHIHLAQGIGTYNNSGSPYYKSNDTYTYGGKTYPQYYPNIEGYECPITDMFFIPKDIEVIGPTSDVAKYYIWTYIDEDEDTEEPEVPSIDESDALLTAYTKTYKGLSIKVGRLAKKDLVIKGSVDSNKPGIAYDKTVPAGFSDKDLLAQGYKEAFGTNGSTFYTYDGATYAEGLDISKGVINNDFGMNTVTSFPNCMAVGFYKDGGMIFDIQSKVQAVASQLYGAVTGAFGIMKDGVKNEAGSEYNRGYCYTNKSGRSILAESDDYVYSIAFYGVTGESGLFGYELYDLVKAIDANMLNAICFDGGGSVFQRIDGEYTITTSRLVKNGVMVFYKEKEETEVPEEPETPEEPVEETISFTKDEYNELLSDLKDIVTRMEGKL